MQEQNGKEGTCEEGRDGGMKKSDLGKGNGYRRKGKHTKKGGGCIEEGWGSRNNDI